MCRVGGDEIGGYGGTSEKKGGKEQEKEEGEEGETKARWKISHSRKESSEREREDWSSKLTMVLAEKRRVGGRECVRTKTAS